MADVYNTISDVRRGADVPFPTISEDDSFVLLKVVGDGVNVSLYGLTPGEAVDALMGVVMAING